MMSISRYGPILIGVGFFCTAMNACSRRPALPNDQCELRRRPAAPGGPGCAAAAPRFAAIPVSTHLELGLPRRAIISDVDGDSVPDLVILSRDLRVTVQSWHHSGTFRLREQTTLSPNLMDGRSLKAGTPKILAGDVDEDGRSDLVLCWSGVKESQCWVWRRRREGGYTEGLLVASAKEPSEYYYWPAIGDFNCDGHLDLAGGQWVENRAQLRVRLGDGMGGFARVVDTPWEPDDSRFPIPEIGNVADVDGDGNLDLVGYYPRSYAPYWRDTGRIGVVRGTVLGVFHPLQALEPEVLWNGLTTADLDGDGRDEVIVRRPASGTGQDVEPKVAVVLSRFDDGTYRRTQSVADPIGRILDPEEDFHVGRLTCPRRLDLLSGDLALLRGDAASQLQAPVALPKEILRVRAVADFNRDGLDDLLASDDREEQVTVWLNQTPQ